MELKLKRYILTEISSIGDLFVNGHHFCKILEDTDRGLDATMSLEQIKSIKVFGKTAIPKGRYEIILSYSPRFKRVLPEIIAVPGYSGVRIHPGNTAQDTEGCLLPGNWFLKDMVINSKATFDTLLSILKERSKEEKMFITIE